MAALGSPEQICAFFQHVDRDPETLCWNWTGYIGSWGYGRVTIDNVLHKAHRAAFLMFCGEIPEGSVVRHECDNPACVNPSHLRLGTVSDNNQDRAKRDRSHAKLNAAEVRAVRRARGTCRAIGRRFGVCASTVSLIKRGQRRQHIGD